MFETLQTGIIEKRCPGRSCALRMTYSISRLDYKEEFIFTDKGKSLELPLDRAGCADWDRHGRLILARDGKILAMQIGPEGQLIEKELIDLNPAKPQSVEAPYWAKKW